MYSGLWERGPLLGKGAFGSVFLAKPTSKFRSFPSLMAVKSAEISVSATLQKEKEVFDNVQGYPFVIHCFGEDSTVEDNGDMVYNLLLEYASGGSLRDLIHNSGGCGLPESDVKRYTKCILKGLNHIHGCGYVHCDIKPENVLLVNVSASTTDAAHFVAKIADLGLAKRSWQRKKMRMDLRGTALYMAPECLIECVQEPPSDIWALGCVVCEMLTGKSPWDRGKEFNKRDLFNLIADERELPEIPTGVSSQAKDFLKACLVKKYMYRFTAEMLMDHPFLDGLADEELPAVTCVSGTDEADYEVFCFSEDYELSCSSGDLSLLPDDGMALCFPPSQFDDLGEHLDGRSDENVPVLGQKRKRVTCYDNHICERAARRTLNCPASTIPAVGA